MITDIVSINPALSIITLNVNGLYTPIKRQTIQVDYKKKTRLNYMLSTHFKCKDTYRLKVKGC